MVIAHICWNRPMHLLVSVLVSNIRRHLLTSTNKQGDNETEESRRHSHRGVLKLPRSLSSGRSPVSRICNNVNGHELMQPIPHAGTYPMIPLKASEVRLMVRRRYPSSQSQSPASTLRRTNHAQQILLDLGNRHGSHLADHHCFLRCATPCLSLA